MPEVVNIAGLWNESMGWLWFLDIFGMMNGGVNMWKRGRQGSDAYPSSMLYVCVCVSRGLAI